MIIPASVEVLCQCCFGKCKSLNSVTFESRSKLQRIESCAFCYTALTSLLLPGSLCFVFGTALATLSLQSMSFWPFRSRFCVREAMIEEPSGKSVIRYFGDFIVVSVRLSVELICESGFHGCKSLESVTFELQSRLRHIAEDAFAWSRLKGPDSRIRRTDWQRCVCRM
jgi:hypothetical protein